MKKRIISVLVVVSLLTALSGCNSMFKKEYLSVSEYKDETQNLSSSDTTQISTFTELKAAIIAMVSGHKAEGRLRFTAYDGTIQDDLSRALLEAKNENALASFAVDYMSYDLSRIVTYYEAVVYITYKKTQSEIDDIRYITGKAELADAIEPVLEEMSSYVALRLTSATVTEEDVISAVNFAYTQNPAGCVVPPSVTVSIHPQSGLQRIIELDFEYGWKTSELEKMRSALNAKTQEIVRSATNVKDAEYAYNLFKQLALSCTYDPTGTVRSGAELDSGLGASAYGALLEYCADSRGFAAAYSALCRAAGIECLVVDGTMDNEAHSWNIIRIEGNYYHVDAAAYYSQGAERSFMQSDEQFKERYVWDLEKYPKCASGEPSPGIIANTF